MSLARRLAIEALRPRPPRGAPARPELDQVRRLLVVRAHDQLGDFLLATPALRALRTRFPDARITLVVNRFLSPLALGQPDADRVLVAPWGRAHGSPDDRARSSFWRALLSEPYELAIVLNTVSHSLSSDLVARLSGARRVAGPIEPPLKDSAGAPLYDWSYAVPRAASSHQMARALAAVAALGCPPVPLGYRFSLSAPERTAGAALRRTLPPGALVALHVGTRDPAKRYPIERWAEAADRVSRRLNAHLVLLDAPDARSARDALADRLGVSHHALPPLGLRQTAALLENVDLLLCHDSALLHLAAAVGTATVSIHGRGDATSWKPPGEAHVALQAPDFVAAHVAVEDVVGAAERAWVAARQSPK